MIDLKRRRPLLFFKQNADGTWTIKKVVIPGGDGKDWIELVGKAAVKFWETWEGNGK